MAQRRVVAGQRVGPRRPAVDPVAQRLDLGGREALALVRHGDLVVGAGHATNQLALAAVAGDDGRLARLAALEGAGLHVEAEAGGVLTAVVAREAAVLEQRQHVVLEIDARLVGGDRGDGQGQEKGDGESEAGSQGGVLRQSGERRRAGSVRD